MFISNQVFRRNKCAFYTILDFRDCCMNGKWDTIFCIENWAWKDRMVGRSQKVKKRWVTSISKNVESFRKEISIIVQYVNKT